MAALIIYQELPEATKLYSIPDDVYLANKETLDTCHGKLLNTYNLPKKVETALCWLSAALQDAKYASDFEVELQPIVGSFTKYMIEIEERPFEPEYRYSAIILTGIVL